MESVLTNACTIKIQNFEGPFDLLFHLIGENKVNIYDIPINIITDQYMEYLFAMRELDLEIASEFIVMAATLLHIKSKMLLPDKKEARQEEQDPRDELVLKLLEYRKYKEFSHTLRQREIQWSVLYYKLPEAIQFTRSDEIIELSVPELKHFYCELLERNRKKMNPNVSGINQIIQHEKVSLKSKMREILRELINRSFFRFAEVFSLKEKSKTDVITGFMAILELARMRKVKLEQRKQFADIYIRKTGFGTDELEDERIAAE
ncbi:MAG: chromosome segregation protein ScpA [Ruminiclostridium sp.]|nr:chromosome segregation protein ScpA [Ruminiclostridium sp.]